MDRSITGLPKSINQIAPYAPIEPYEVLSQKLGFTSDQITKLDANENPYGPSPNARLALANLSFPHIYPDPESRALRQALAKFTGVSVDALMAGSGADELLDLILRAYIQLGDKVVICPPTFGMYSFLTFVNAGQICQVPRRQDFSLDMPELMKTIKTEKPKILFLARPNNPDGGLPLIEQINALLDQPILIVIDEAYIEFTSNGGRLGEKLSLINEVEKRDNLVVLRTFSKWAGMAGLRVGYGAFPGWLISALWKIKQPYNVNVAGTQAALASLEDLDWLAENVALLRKERTRLIDKFDNISFLSPIPSESNFVLCRVKGMPASELKGRLAKKGVLVRHYASDSLADCIRVSVGRPQDTEKLINALMEVS